MSVFSGIIGKVGSGKSSLLTSILGEMTKVSGKIAANIPFSGIGYVQQEPWLQQSSVRDNILFGKMFQPDWYDAVLDACALKEDMKQLTKGDLTNVGESGVMLSGGQKARVALARAVYQDKEVYLIDDIFSALDVQVSTQIFRKCINGLLRNKTRILCTHHPRFLGSASNILMLDDGQVVDSGLPAKILPKLALQFQDELSERNVNKRRRSVAEIEEKNLTRRLSSYSLNEEETTGIIHLKIFQQL